MAAGEASVATTRTCGRSLAIASAIAPLPAARSSTLQALQALQLVLGIGPAPARGIVAFDLPGLSVRTLRAERRVHCDHGPGARPGLPDDEPLELEFESLTDARSSGLELVYIREAWERQFDRPGSRIERHLPMSALLDGQLAFPTEGRVLVVCAHGVRSLALVEQLREQGRAGVYSMRGGLAALRT
jgi:rhodanese-related sulfurtransferase